MTLRPPPSLKAKALELLAQREHSRLELQGKLQRWLLARERVRRSMSLADSHRAPAVVPDALGHQGPEADETDGVQIQGLLDELETAGWLSQARYVESRIQAKSARWGLRRLEQTLATQGAVLASDQREALQQSEKARAQAVWMRRFGEAPRDAAEQARQMRFLLGRGFRADIARDIIRHAGSDAAGSEVLGGGDAS